MNTPIPQPRRWPVIGNLPELDIANPIQSMMELANKYGPIFRLQVPTEDLIIVSSQSLTHELCDESRFDKKVHGPLEIVRDFAGNGLITAYTSEENWESAHRVLSPAFGPAFLRSMFAPMQDLTEQLLLKWERHGAERSIDVSSDMTRLTVDTITLCAFSHRLNSFYDSKLHPFVQAMFDGLVEASARVRRPPFVSSVLFGKKSHYRANTKTMMATAEALIAERRLLTAEQMPKDILSLMLSAKDEVTGQRLSDENIRNQIVTFLIAGHETTSGLLSFAIYELLNQPDLLKQAVAHVDQVCGDRPVTFEAISKLTYLDQVLKETLRLWPTAPAFAFRCKDDETVLTGGYKVRRDQTILLLLPALHRDQSVWPAPETFSPERMEKGLFEALPPDSWKPFGNGRRSCIGRMFAMQEATLALAMILQKFDLVNTDPQFKLKIVESLTLKPANLYVRAQPRKNPAPRARESNQVASSRPEASRGPFTVLFGSHSGTASEYAEMLASEARSRGYRVVCEPLDSALTELPTEGMLAVVCASYDGRAPKNAAQFVKYAAQEKAPVFASLKFTVFGCGNRDWARTYQSIPKWLDRRIAELGAERVFERGEGDSRGDSRADFSKWMQAFWLSFDVSAATYSKQELFDYELLPPAADPLAFVVSDPRSEQLAKHFGLSADALLSVRGHGETPEPSPRSVRAHKFFTELPLDRACSVEVLASLIENTACPPHRIHLEKLRASGEYANFTALDLLVATPSCQLTLRDFVRLLT